MWRLRKIDRDAVGQVETHFERIGSVSITGASIRKQKAMWLAVMSSGKENQPRAHLLTRLSSEFRKKYILTSRTRPAISTHRPLQDSSIVLCTISLQPPPDSQQRLATA